MTSFPGNPSRLLQALDEIESALSKVSEILKTRGVPA
jgi:hypothetical protein